MHCISPCAGLVYTDFFLLTLMTKWKGGRARWGLRRCCTGCAGWIHWAAASWEITRCGSSHHSLDSEAGATWKWGGRCKILLSNYQMFSHMIGKSVIHLWHEKYQANYQHALIYDICDQCSDASSVPASYTSNNLRETATHQGNRRKRGHNMQFLRRRQIQLIW